jgi:hypothetical protein
MTRFVFLDRLALLHCAPSRDNALSEPAISSRALVSMRRWSWRGGRGNPTWQRGRPHAASIAALLGAMLSAHALAVAARHITAGPPQKALPASAQGSSATPSKSALSVPARSSQLGTPVRRATRKSLPAPPRSVYWSRPLEFTPGDSFLARRPALDSAAETLVTRGTKAMTVGQYREAEQGFARALVFIDPITETESRAQTLYLLGWTLAQQERWMESERRMLAVRGTKVCRGASAFGRAFALNQKTFGPEDPSTIQSSLTWG